MRHYYIAHYRANKSKDALTIHSMIIEADTYKQAREIAKTYHTPTHYLATIRKI